MDEDGKNINHKIPDEMLIRVFEFLTPKSVATCRVVCSRWHQIMDYVLHNETLWRKHCTTDYGDIYQSAHKNSTKGLSWFNIYKSLTLWSKLPHCQETIEELSLTKEFGETCVNCQIIRDGVVGVVKDRSVVYYNVNTLQQLQELTIADNDYYFMYRENDDMIFLLNYNDELLIRRKDNRNEIVRKFDQVSLFDVLEIGIYYSSISNTIYVVTDVDGNYTSTKIVQIRDTVLSFGCTDGILYILTLHFHIYSYVNNTLNSVLCQGSRRDRLEALRKYNFANLTDWASIYHIYKSFLYKQDKKSKNNNLILIRIHGPVMFAGYENCILRIYHSLYIVPVIDLLKSKPLKEYYLLKPYEDGSICAIVNIEALEGENNLTVLVAMTLRMIVIKFNYSLNSEEFSSSHAIPSTGKVESLYIKEILTSSEGRITSCGEPSTSSEEISINSGESSNSSGEESDSIREPRPKIAKWHNSL